jgi:hypothetical protein
MPVAVGAKPLSRFSKLHEHGSDGEEGGGGGSSPTFPPPVKNGLIYYIDRYIYLLSNSPQTNFPMISTGCP